MTFLTLWLNAALLILGLMTALWLLSLALKDSSIVDIFWGTGFVITFWFTYFTSGLPHPTSLTLLGVVVTLWGLRLSLYILSRNAGHGEDFRYAAKAYIERRNEDIAKQEQKVAFIEGFTSAGLAAISESAGTWAGPFAPLVTLGLGYLIKRRNDKTPDEYRKAKEESYNKGLEFGKALADAARNQAQES